MRLRWLETGAVAVVAGATMALAAGPAGASTTATYAGQAQGASFSLQVGSQAPSTSGASSADVTSVPAAAAVGSGSVSPLGSQGVQRASVTGAGQSRAYPKPACGSPPPPKGSPITIEVACGSAQASTAGGLPRASATGQVVKASISLPAASGLAVVPGNPLFKALQSATGKSLSQVPAGGEPLGQVLTKVLKLSPGTASLTLGGTLQPGASTSTVTATAATVTAQATSTGAELDLFPMPVTGTPVLTIKVGQSSAQAVLDRATGAITPSEHPAVATVTVCLAGTSCRAQTITPGAQQPIVIPPGRTPVAVVSAGTGTATTHKDGSVTATSTSLGIQLLPGTQGPVDLALGSTRATVGAPQPASAPTTTAAPTTTVAPTTTTPERTLPYTGERPWIPLAGFGSLALAFGTWRLRDRLR